MYEQLKLSNQLCHRYYVAANAITRAYTPFLNELDITYPQYIVLLALWQQNGLEVGHIKELTRIDGGALTLILKKLNAKSFIELVSSEHDKRIKQVWLTEKGKETEIKAKEIPLKLRCAIPEMTDQELELLKSLTDKVIAGLIDKE